MKGIAPVIFVLILYGCSQPERSYEDYVIDVEERISEMESEYDTATNDRRTELDSLYALLEMEMVGVQKEFIRDHPDSLRSVFLLYEIDWSFKSLDDFWTYIRMIDTSLHDNPYYTRLVRLTEQAEKVQVGQKAPGFTMNDTKGEQLSLSSVYSASSYTLLDFWASNCSPCRQENPHIRAAWLRYREQGFKVMGVSTDTDREAWLRAIREDSLTWDNVCSFERWSDHPVVLSYALSQTSQNFLLDSQGTIIARDLRGEALEEKLSQLLD